MNHRKLLKSWVINFLFISKRHVQVKVLSNGIPVTRNVQATVSKSVLCITCQAFILNVSCQVTSQSSVSCQSVKYIICRYNSARVGRSYIYYQFLVYYFLNMIKFQVPFKIHWSNLPFIPFRENQYETTVTASAWPSKAYEVRKLSQICYCNS